MMKRNQWMRTLFGVLGIVALLAVPMSEPAAKKGGNGGGRLSPASLDVDTCGCPTSFTDPTCQEQAEWLVEKDAEVDSVANFFDGALFEVRVIEGQTRTFLTGSGQLIVSNSGGQSTYLTSVVLNLQDQVDPNTPGLGGNENGSRKCGDGRDNDGDDLVDGDDPDCWGTWLTEASTLLNEQGTACGDTANTCQGTFVNAENSELLLWGDEDRTDPISLTGSLEIPPGADNDGDGKVNEDPAFIEGVCFGIYDNDKDGQIDEDPGMIDDDGDGQFGEDCDDDDRDGQINEDPFEDGINEDQDCLDGSTYVWYDDDNDAETPDVFGCPDYTGGDRDGEDGQSMDDDGDTQADEDCDYRWDPNSIEGNNLDDDGDGLFDEDGADDDGDGLLDEDSGCADTTIFWFDYSFDITDLGIEGPGDGIVPSADDLRVELLATFKSGGERGGICEVDTDCDGSIDNDEKYSRTVQQRHEFDPVDCAAGTPCAANLIDEGAVSLDTGCATVTSDTLNEAIPHTGIEGTTTTFFLDGTVSCNGGACGTVVTNTAELQFATLERVQPSLDDLEGEGQYDYARVKVQRTGPSYFKTTISDLDGPNLVLEGWCIDNGNFIQPGSTYCANLISSYGDDIPSWVDQPEDLDLVNWVINQDYVGRPAGPGLGNYTMCDVQTAIWTLVDDQGASSCGSRNWTRVQQIIAEAEAAGGGFEPTCDESISVILEVVNCNTGLPLGGPGSQYVQATVVAWPMGGVAGLPGVCDCDEGIVGDPASASFPVVCNDVTPNIEPGDFCSQTQGGWGTQNCNGNNTACLRDTYFGTVFPNGLTIGDLDGVDADTDWALELSSSATTQAYIEGNRGRYDGPLTADLTDPLVSPLGTFGNQLVAATLNVGFDAAGIGKCTLLGNCDFPNASGTLGTLVYGDCVVDGLAGWSVTDVIALANTVAAGDVEALPAGVSVSDLTNALAILNQEFVDCLTVATGCLSFPQ